jgi:hypothetical protein
VLLKVVSSAAFCGSPVAGLKSGTASRTFSTPRLVPPFTQSCARTADDRRQETGSSASVHTRPRKALGHRLEFGLALSSIRVGVKHTPYDNIVSRYELLCKVSSLLSLVQFENDLPVRHPERNRFSGGAKDLAGAKTQIRPPALFRPVAATESVFNIVPPIEAQTLPGGSGSLPQWFTSCNQTTTPPKSYFPNNPTATGQKYQCAATPAPPKCPAKVHHWIALPARSPDVRRAPHRT